MHHKKVAIDLLCISVMYILLCVRACVCVCLDECVYLCVCMRVFVCALMSVYAFVCVLQV